MQSKLFRDELNKTLFFSAVVCLLLAFALSGIPAAATVFRLLSLAFAAYYLVRMLSKNASRRYNENQKYLTAVTAVGAFFRNLFRPKPHAHKASASSADGHGAQAKKGGFRDQWNDYRTYRYLLCPQCGQRLRVPKGKGKIRVTCTRCQNKFLAKS